MTDLDKRIDEALHPERNGVKMAGIAEGASHEHVIKSDLKALFRDLLRECRPERGNPRLLGEKLDG